MSKRPLCYIDTDVSDGRPPKTVAFQIDDESGRLSSARCELVGASDAGQSLPRFFPIRWY